MASGNQLFTEDGILPGLGKKTQKAREDAFLKLLQHFERKESEKIMLDGFFDLMDEHGVYVADKEVDELCALSDENGDIEHTQLFDYARNSKFWEILIKKDVYANEEVLKLMTKTYDLSGRAKGPPKISKLDTINKAINKVSSAFTALDKDKDGFVTKRDFERAFPSLTSVQVDACFKKFDKDKDGMLNFTEFKNFMGKRKSLPDKALARCTSTLSLRSGPPGYSTLSISSPPKYEDIAE
eukprot:TRINITY_DN30273_c0_g1_i1.p1 TRINITY_DN30273_c0_g1~~TRINITY_DN30273_c0_g1_i1.p1  ORF type:complete len:250 (+),score=70.48 TRINITY_DN30273_c0_g1_i1:32-751(+)